jgi:HPt (histidine-containing phosphotransfer) domain-containing protein
MDDYLSKPVELDDLSDVLERWIAPESQHSRRPAERETETAPPASPPTSHNGQVAQNPSDDTPLNLQRLHNLSRGKIALQKRLLQAFLDAADSDIDALGQAMESGNLEELGKLAHRLKGSAGNVGAETFSAIASQLEQWASHTHPQSTDSPDKAQGYFQELQHQLERLQAFVQTQLQS